MKVSMKFLSWAAAGVIAAGTLIGCGAPASVGTAGVNPLPESTGQSTTAGAGQVMNGQGVTPVAVIAPPPNGGVNPATTPEFNGPMMTAVPAGTLEVGPAVTGLPGDLTEVATNGGPGDGEVNTLRLTMAENGKTVTLKVGDEILLYLEGDVAQPVRLWSVQIADQNVLRPVMGVMVIKGAQGLYKANQPGTTTLTATGDLPCRQSTPPCMAPSIAFQVTVAVQ